MFRLFYLKESGKAGEIDVAFKDIYELTLNAIAEGIADFTMTPQQYLMGYWSVTSMYLYKKYGFSLPYDVRTGPTFVNKTNLEKVREFADRMIW